MKTTVMTVEQLRKRASELGIKNIKKYKKDELIALIEEAEKEVGLEGQTPEQKQALNDFIKTYNGTTKCNNEQIILLSTKHILMMQRRIIKPNPMALQY